MRIAQCHLNVLVSQKSLHTPQVDARLNEARGTGMPQNVRNHLLVLLQATLLFGLVPMIEEPLIFDGGKGAALIIRFLRRHPNHDPDVASFFRTQRESSRDVGLGVGDVGHAHGKAHRAIDTRDQIGLAANLKREGEQV